MEAFGDLEERGGYRGEGEAKGCLRSFDKSGVI